MNTQEIEKTRAALIRQWNRTERQPWWRRFSSLQVQTVVLVVLSSLAVGAIPIVYRSIFHPQALPAADPTQAGIWGALGTQD